MRKNERENILSAAADLYIHSCIKLYEAMDEERYMRKSAEPARRDLMNTEADIKVMLQAAGFEFEDITMLLKDAREKAYEKFYYDD